MPLGTAPDAKRGTIWPMSDVMNIGFLGLGQMGGPIAERLLGKDWKLHVYDPRPAAMETLVAAGATAHGSPASVADVATVIFSSLPSQDVSVAVALGPNGIVHGKAVRVYAEMSTIGGQTLDRIASGLSANGIRTIDAPVTGGPPAARAGTLTIMVSGEAAALAAVQPILAMMGKNVICVGGRSGMAQTMTVI